MADATFEPDIEKVSEFSVLDVVVVRWIDGDIVNLLVLKEKQPRRRSF